MSAEAIARHLWENNRARAKLFFGAAAMRLLELPRIDFAQAQVLKMLIRIWPQLFLELLKVAGEGRVAEIAEGRRTNVEAAA